MIKARAACARAFLEGEPEIAGSGRFGPPEKLFCRLHDPELAVLQKHVKVTDSLACVRFEQTGHDSVHCREKSSRK